MLLSTRESRRWGLVTLAALVVVAGVWWVVARRGFAHGGSATGLTLGFVALGLILLLTAYGVRKRRYRSTVGRLETWLQSHVWLGLLTLFVAGAHAGERFRDPTAKAAFFALAATVATGLAGAVLYRVVPRRMTEIEGDLTEAGAADRLNQLASAMARLAAGRSPTFARLAQRVLAEARPGRFAGWKIVFQPGAGKVGRGGPQAGGADDAAWGRLLGAVPPGEQDDLRRLLVLSRQHKELHGRLIARRRYQNLLDAWLWLHLPATAVLLVLVFVHAATALYYRGL